MAPLRLLDLEHVEHNEGIPVAAVAPASELGIGSGAEAEEQSALPEYLIAAGFALYA